MKKILLSVSLVITTAMFYSCYYDKEELLYPSAGGCSDTTGTVSYTQKIVPLFTRACYSCHAGNSPSGAIQMGTYASDKAIAANGKLYGSISHASGFSPMPQGTPALSVCEQALVQKWITAGMQNN